jgi:hypothetical protein
MMEPVGEVDTFTTNSQGDESDVPINSLVTPNKRGKKQRRKSTEPNLEPTNWWRTKEYGNSRKNNNG